MTSHISRNRADSGNVLFLILIAVALFAALSYAVTSSSKGGGNNIADDKAKLAASTLVQFATDIEIALSRQTLMGGISWSQIQYGSYGNPDCLVSTCKLDHPDGGGASLIVPKIIVDHPNSGNVRFRFIKVANVGSDLPELAILIGGVSNKVCQNVNKLMKIPSSSRPDGIPFVEDITGTETIDGYGSATLIPLSIASNPANILIADVGKVGSSPEVAGHRTFCICRDNSSACGREYSKKWARRFWHVIVAR